MTPCMIPGSCSIDLPSAYCLACTYMIYHNYAHIQATLYRICHLRGKHLFVCVWGMGACALI